MAEGTEHSGDAGISRRELVKRAGVGAGGVLLSGVAAAPAWARPKLHDASNTIKIGFVSPRTGPASGFGEPDGYVLGLARKALAKGLTVAGKQYSVQVNDQDGTNDYSAQIGKFKSEGVEIFNTFPIPPDFATFWRQAAQQGLTKQIKIAQIAKTGLFASQVSALGSLGFDLASGAYWGPTWPYHSSLTGIKNKDLAAGYTKVSGKQWNQQLGPSLALFDVAAAVLKASGNPKDKTKVANAMKHLSGMTPLGVLHWGTGGAKNPVPNVVATPIPGGQWVRGSGKYKYVWVYCEHTDDHRIPIQAKLKPYS